MTTKATLTLKGVLEAAFGEGTVQETLSVHAAVAGYEGLRFALARDQSDSLMAHSHVRGLEITADGDGYKRIRRSVQFKAFPTEAQLAAIREKAAEVLKLAGEAKVRNDAANAVRKAEAAAFIELLTVTGFRHHELRRSGIGWALVLDKLSEEQVRHIAAYFDRTGVKP